MSVYIYPIATAIAIFPILSALFTLPYVIHQYHKYGALLILRIIVVYSFIFYMMTSYFMTILPLPPIESVKDSGTSMLLVPFAAFRLWINSSGLVLSDPSTYLPALANYNFLQIAFNILLLLPFGVYLRYYFERKWYQVLILSFLYSLFFELTQLSGLYGIYPHPYRWFEVDDLICNTFGGMVGFWITPLCSFFLPGREKLDEMSYRRGQKISFLRRGLAFVIDAGIVVLISNIAIRAVNVKYDLHSIIGTFHYDNPNFILLTFLLLFVSMTFTTWLTGGRTAGKAIVNIKVIAQKKRHPGILALTVRNAILYLGLLPIPVYIYLCLEVFNNTQSDREQIMTGAGMIVLATAFLYFVLHVFVCAVTRKSVYFYERLTRTSLVSTIEVRNAQSTEVVQNSDAESENKGDSDAEPDTVDAAVTKKNTESVKEVTNTLETESTGTKELATDSPVGSENEKSQFSIR